MRIALLGGGPAGMSCALWLKNMGFDSVILESAERLGGLQNLHFLKNISVLGQIERTGPELAADFADHVARANIRIVTRVQVERITRTAEGALILGLLTPGGAVEIDCAALVIATGTRYRGREVLAETPGLDSIPATSFRCGPYCFVKLDDLVSRHVLVVGAGDNAYENAVMLLERGAAVTLLARSSPCAQGNFQRKAGAHPAFTLLRHARAEQARCERGSVELRIRADERTTAVTVDRIHILAGYAPNTAQVATLLASGLGQAPTLNPRGYLVADADGRTSIANVYAAGDVCNQAFPSVVSAVASGARAARAIEFDLGRIGLLHAYG